LSVEVIGKIRITAEEIKFMTWTAKPYRKTYNECKNCRRKMDRY